MEHIETSNNVLPVDNSQKNNILSAISTYARQARKW